MISVPAATASETDLQTALYGAYSGLRNVDLFGRTVPVLGDLMADNAYVSLLNSGRYIPFNLKNFVVNDGNVTGFWDAAYSTILRCNNIINATVPSSANVDQYKGEAYSIRALCYFTLVRYFARPYTDNPAGLGVPIVTKFDANLLPPRNTITEVYTLIKSDLEQGYKLMTKFTNSSQFSKYAARGLESKVYLTMGDKANALATAVDVINNSGFTVVPAASYISYWNAALPRTDKVETLFEVSSDAISNNGFDALPNIYSQSGYGDLLASSDFYNLLSPNDVRSGLYKPGKRGGINVIFINKYPNTFGTDISDTKIIRMSEIYLIAAEASLPGDEASALNYLNYITSRRNADPVVATGSDLFEAIITERRKELAFEGDRLLDLNRLKRDITRDNEYPSATLSIPYSDTRRILPIPQQELDANVNIRSQQNPGF